MIYITGDTHGFKDVEKFNSYFFNQNINKKGNIVIITGDCGATWNHKTMQTARSFYEKFDCLFLFVDGNNENFDILDNLKVEKFAGGKIHKVAKNLFHLMRGEIFELEGLTFLAFGGADSWDAPTRFPFTTRLKGLSWWQRECPSMQEFQNAVKNLKSHKNTVDFIVTHEGTSQYARHFNSLQEDVCKMNDQIEKLAKFRFWFAGHHHRTDTVGRIQCMFNNFVNIDEYKNLPCKGIQSSEELSFWM